MIAWYSVGYTFRVVSSSDSDEGRGDFGKTNAGGSTTWSAIGLGISLLFMWGPIGEVGGLEYNARSFCWGKNCVLSGSGIIAIAFWGWVSARLGWTDKMCHVHPDCDLNRQPQISRGQRNHRRGLGRLECGIIGEGGIENSILKENASCMTRQDQNKVQILSKNVK